jgi:hypothetical protein
VSPRGEVPCNHSAATISEVGHKVRCERWLSAQWAIHRMAHHLIANDIVWTKFLKNFNEHVA